MSPEPDSAPLRVLLVEDNTGYAFGIRHTLLYQQRGRFTCEHAHTLAEAEAALAAAPADIILLDLGLPDSARFETFSRVQAAAPDVPVIILTVLDDDDVATQALRAGAQDYLLKDTVDGTILARTICYAVERHRIQRELRRLSARLLRAQEDERRRLARELHETTAQKLAALTMTLAGLQAAPALPPAAAAQARECAALAEDCARELRTFSYLLHPPLLEEIGLAAVLADYARGFEMRSGIAVALELPPAAPRLPAEVETALFRVVQECLTNIHRHAQSPTAAIRLRLAPHAAALTVSDAGRGLQAAAETEEPEAAIRLGVGIAGMRDRIEQLGGRLTVHSGPAGTAVTATVPLDGEAPA